MRKPRISNEKINKIIINFVLGCTATSAAEATSISRNSINQWYKRIRERLWDYGQFKPRFSGEVEVDQVQLGWRTNNGKKYERIKVIAGLQRNNKQVYAVRIDREDKGSLVKFITELVEKGSTVITDSWSGYDDLSKLGYTHRTINHSERWSDGKGTHTANVDAFFNVSKCRLNQYCGLSRQHADLYIKECEYVWNQKKFFGPERSGTFQNIVKKTKEIVFSISPRPRQDNDGL